MKNYSFVFILLIAASVASGGAILTIGTPVDFEAVGNMVEVDVTLSGLATTLDSSQFDVDFTPGVLSFSGMNAGAASAVDNFGGSVTGLGRSNMGLNFGGTLFKLFFKASGPGTSFLSIPTSSVTLLDSSGKQIPFATVGGNVFVTGAAPTEAPDPGSLGLLAVGLAVMGVTCLQKRLARC